MRTVPLEGYLDHQTTQPLLKRFTLKPVENHGRKDQFLHKRITTLNNGYLGSRNDEERSEMRYVV